MNFAGFDDGYVPTPVPAQASTQGCVACRTATQVGDTVERVRAVRAVVHPPVRFTAPTTPIVRPQRRAVARSSTNPDAVIIGVF